MKYECPDCKGTMFYWGTLNGYVVMRCRDCGKRYIVIDAVLKEAEA